MPSDELWFRVVPENPAPTAGRPRRPASSATPASTCRLAGRVPGSIIPPPRTGPARGSRIRPAGEPRVPAIGMISPVQSVRRRPVAEVPFGGPRPESDPAGPPPGRARRALDARPEWC
ncbi:hypothetical protein GCM10010123_42480 [Pilimelia anulata]|uniref:Uncharacterized protein n=1 Tax=Pilimelia anulata TaxID=53371 RepID=A0A8J3BHB9_9ACTN|nr:hypothetical protein GCM10010123_42480 [Pilimelia anulata]